MLSGVGFAKRKPAESKHPWRSTNAEGIGILDCVFRPLRERNTSLRMTKGLGTRQANSLYGGAHEKRNRYSHQL